MMRSGSVAAIASANDISGARPRYVCIRRTTPVLLSGCLGGHTASTMQPAFASAIAKRAVGNQRDVAATRMVGFTLSQTSVPPAGRSLEIGSRDARGTRDVKSQLRESLNT